MASSAAVELVVNLQDNASPALSGIASSMGTVGKAAAGLAAGGLLAVGAGLGGALAAGLSFNNSMEQTTARLNAFTKDSGKSAEILDLIRDRASKTPFAFEEMANAAAGLLPATKAANMSLEEIMSTAEVLAASNPAEGLEGAAFAIREAVSGDFASAIERFNLPRQMINQLKAEGVPNMEIVRRAMQEMGYDTSLVSNLAETASGRWSTFKDTLTGLAATATGSLFESLSGGMGTVNAALEANAPLLESFAQAIGERIGQAISWLATTALPALVAGFQTVWTLLQPGLVVLNELRLTFQDAGLFSIEFAESLSLIHPALQPLWLAVSDGVGVLKELWLSFQDAGLLSLEFAESLSLVHPSLQTLWLSLMDVVEEALPLFQQGMAMIGPLIQQVVSIAVPLIVAFVQSWIERFRMILSLVQAVMPSIQSIITSVLSIVGAFMQRHGAEIQQFMVSAWTQIQNITRLAVEVIRAVVVPAFQFIAAHIAAHKTEIVEFLSGAWTIIKNVIQGALTLIQGVLRATLQVLQGDWRGAWETIKSTVSSVLDNIKGIIQGGVQAFAGIIRAVGPSLQAAGTAIVNMLRSGISSAWAGLTSFFSGKLGELRNLLPFSEPKDAASPLRGLAKAGESILRNVAEGIPSGAAILNDKLTGSLKNTADLIESSVKAMTALANFDGSAIEEDTAFNFAEKLQWVVKAIGDVAANFKTKAMDHAAAFAESAGKVLGLVGSGVDALTKLSQYDEGSLLGDVVDGFTDDLGWVVSELSTMASDFDLKAMGHAAAFADSAGKVVGVIGTGIDALVKLSTYKANRLLGDVVDGFTNDLGWVISELSTMAVDFDLKAMGHAAAFAESASKVVGVIGTGIDALVKLSTYKANGLLGDVVDGFVNDLGWVISELSTMAADFEVKAMAHAAAFASAAGDVLSMIGGGVDAIIKLASGELTDVPGTAMQTFVGNITRLVIQIEEAAEGFSQQGLQAADRLAKSMGGVFGAITGGVTALDKLRTFEAVPQERMEAFLRTMTSVLELMVRAAVQAEQYLKQAEAWRDMVVKAKDAILEGIAALSQINKIPNMPDLPAVGGDIATQVIDGAKDQLGIASPSKEFQKIGMSIVDGVIWGIDSKAKTLTDRLKGMFDLGGVISGIGGTVAGMFGDTQLNPIKDALTAVGGALKAATGDVADRQREREQIESRLLAIDEERLKLEAKLNDPRTYTETVSKLRELQREEAQLVARRADALRSQNARQQDANRQQEEANRLAQEQEAIQARITAFQEKQQKLSFLQQQVKLLDTIKEYGLDAAQVLGGIQLGANVNADAMLGVFDRLLGGITARLGAELSRATGGSATPVPTTRPSGSVINNNYNLTANYAYQAERTVRDDLRTLQLLGAA